VLQQRIGDAERVETSVSHYLVDDGACAWTRLGD
jgi:hypothetical protein